MNSPSVCRVWEIWRNPIFLRYSRARLRPVATFIACLISLLLSGFMFFIIRAITTYRTQLETVDVERGPLIALLVIQALILFVLGTAQVSGGITAERDEGVIDYQRLLPMTPAAKVLGYLFGLPVREYVMFVCTLPFTIWCLWFGQVPAATWLAVYGVMASTTVLYHLTGLVTGTIVKNRRWAFLASIGLIFALYTVVPQAAKFGLVILKYFTINPVIDEALPSLIPRQFGKSLELGRSLMSDAKFFGFEFSHASFTFLAQSGLILTFFVMLCRRWRQAESHLMNKLWALGFFAWFQVLLLGNAQGLIESGKLFPTNQLELITRVPVFGKWRPMAWEAPVMILVYGVATVVFLLVLANIVTPQRGMQINGWRRARKLERNRLPLLADEANASGVTLLMAMMGGVGWYLFTKLVLESRWMPDTNAPLVWAGFFTLAVVTCTMLYQLLLESRGGRTVVFAAIFIGVLPVMIAAIMGGSSDSLISAAIWLAGMCPLTLPVFAMCHFLRDLIDVNVLKESVSPAYFFWQSFYGIAAIVLAIHLHQARSKIRSLTMES